MAVWFHAEQFSMGQNPKLFGAQTHDSGRIKVSLMPLKAGMPASVITVTVFDASDVQ